MVDEGISQTIRNQGQEEIPHLFAYAHLLLSIGMTDGRYGTTRTPRKFWAQWREEEFSEDHFRQIKNIAKETDPRAAILKSRAMLRSAEHTSELQSLMRNSYAVFCLTKKTINHTSTQDIHPDKPHTH